MKTPDMKTFVLAVTSIFVLTGCFREIQTSDPKKAFAYWAGHSPAGFEFINGQYWQSPHWTMEYIVCLEFKPTQEWWNELVSNNNLVVDTNKWTFVSSNKVNPDWFNPSTNSIRYRMEGNSDRGRYFWDVETGVCFVYEIQL